MSRAIDLFAFISDGTEYYLTSSEEQQTHGGETYLPAAISRGSVNSKNELSKANLEVQLALGHALAQALLAKWGDTTTTLTVFSKRTLSTETIWKGRLVNTVPGDAELGLRFESLFTSMRRPGLRARFQKICRHPLYGRGCFLDPEDFAVAATVDAITGVVLTVPEAALQADGYYSGGMVRAPNGSLTYVSQHVGDQLTLNRISYGIGAGFEQDGPGMAVTLYPGCAHDYATCRDKFANDDNYGGFDYIPSKNPMGGSSIV